MNIKEFGIEDIKPYWRNPRNNDQAIEAVKTSIQKYGYNQPIVVDKENTIVVGHARYKALMELGYKKIGVVVADIDDQKAKEYRIADNKTSELSDWDEDSLIFELREVEDLDDIDLFFDDGELDELIEIEDDSSTDFNEEERKREIEEEVRARVQSDEEVEDEEESEQIVQATVQTQVEDEKDQYLQRENERIQEKEEKEKEKFSKKSDEKGDDYVEINCPHCDEKYILSKGELLRAAKVQRPL